MFENLIQAREYLPPHKVDTLIYNSTADGFAGKVAYEYWNRLYEKVKYKYEINDGNTRNVDYISDTDIQKDMYVGKNVLVLGKVNDTILKEIIHKSNRVLVLKCQKEEYPSEEYLYNYCNLTHSICTITWRYLFFTKRCPDVFYYIEDNAIDNHLYPRTREFSIYFKTMIPFEYEEYIKFMKHKSLIEDAKTKGKLIIDYHNMVNKKANESLKCHVKF